MEREKVELEEAVQLGAVDGVFFAQYFFPRTARQRSPAFHADINALLDRPDARYCGIEAFRGSAKTTLLRMFAARRVSYSLSRTILYIGKSEGHAIRSLDWLRRQVAFNARWAHAFGLRKGEKWQGTEAEIWHEGFDEPIWILALGIEGSIRGVNLDDYRPDLIILDDVIDDENAATPDGRKKISERIHGAIKESLASVGECPNAKLVFLNTPIHQEDAIEQALRDPEWTTLRQGCWTRETEDLDLYERESVWPELFPTETLRKEKEYAIQRGTVHIFNREKECRITSPDTAPLKPQWLQTYELCPERSELLVCMGVDPVPKPTDRQVAKGLHGKDYEVYHVWGRKGNAAYLLERVAQRGHDPSWSVATYIRLVQKWRPRRVRVDSTAYQSTLAWIFERAMRSHGVYAVIDEVQDRRSKFDKILDCLQPLGANGAIFVPPSAQAFITQWGDYPDTPHDDELDAAQLALSWLFSQQLPDSDVENLLAFDENMKPIPLEFYGAP